MATDDTSSLINTERLGTYDTLLKNYIDTNTQAGELLEQVSIMIEDVNAGSKTIIAEAISDKGVPVTADNTYEELAAAIDSIKLPSGNATPSQVLAGATFSNSSGEQLTGTIPSLAAQTITPGTSNKTIASGQYLSGTQTIAGDADLTAANIRSGVNIFGVAGSFTSNATATAAQILTGKTAGVNGSIITGTMADNGAVSPTALNAGGSYTIPAGYHNGSGKVTTNTLASQTSADAAAANILKDKTAWVNGSKITGTMTNNGAITQAINAGGSYTIPAGYHNGSGKVTGNSLASQTSGTATAAQILSGKTAWVGGSQLTGTMTDRGAVSQTLAINGSYTIPAGYHNGSGKVTQSITTKAAATYTPGTSNQTIAAGQYLSGAQTISGSSNLVAGNIKSGVKIFNVTGTMKDASSISGLSLESKTYTVSGQKTVSNPTSGTAILMGTITLPGMPFCIYLPGHWGSARTSNSLYSFNGCGLDHGYTSSSNISHLLGGYQYSGSRVSGVAYFPALDAIAQYEDYYEGVEIVTGGVVSKFTSQSTTPFTWKSGQFSSSSSSIQYTLARWYLYFSSDFKTGYIYGVPVQFTYGAYGEYSAGAKSMTSPTSITFGNIAFF